MLRETRDWREVCSNPDIGNLGDLEGRSLEMIFVCRQTFGMKQPLYFLNKEYIMNIYVLNLKVNKYTGYLDYLSEKENREKHYWKV